jgi:hypothetical protein
MHPIAVLHQHLQKAVPSIHGTRLKALMAAVGSVLCGAQVSITSLGRGLSNTAFIKHKIKRMDRLIGNTRLYQERWRFYAACHSKKQARREREPWLLVASLSLHSFTAKQVMKLYQARMQIEEGFRDSKNHRYGLGVAKGEPMSIGQ